VVVLERVLIWFSLIIFWLFLHGMTVVSLLFVFVLDRYECYVIALGILIFSFGFCWILRLRLKGCHAFFKKKHANHKYVKLSNPSNMCLVSFSDTIKIGLTCLLNPATVVLLSLQDSTKMVFQACKIQQK